MKTKKALKHQNDTRRAMSQANSQNKWNFLNSTIFPGFDYNFTSCVLLFESLSSKFYSIELDQQHASFPQHVLPRSMYLPSQHLSSLVLFYPFSSECLFPHSSNKFYRYQWFLLLLLTLKLPEPIEMKVKRKLEGILYN